MRLKTLSFSFRRNEEKLVLEKKKEARESLIASLESSKADDIFERMAELALSGKTEGNSLADFVAAFRSL